MRAYARCRIGGQSKAPDTVDQADVHSSSTAQVIYHSTREPRSTDAREELMRFSRSNLKQQSYSNLLDFCCFIESGDRE